MRRARLIFAWYDLWIGAYIDRPNQRLYLFPVPCLGLVIDWSPRPPRTGTPARLVLPSRATTRDQARHLTTTLPPTGQITVDASPAAAITAAFLDELVKRTIEDHPTRHLLVTGITTGHAQYAQDAARRRSCRPQLTTTTRTA